MVVIKFGGTSVGSAERIKNLTDIVKAHRDRNPIVVVSAVGGITDKLLAAAAKAYQKREIDTQEIVDNHKQILSDLNLDSNLVDEELKELEEILFVISRIRDQSPKIIDIISSFGERMSAKLVAAYLASIGISSQSFNAYDIGMITDSNFGAAEPLPEAFDLLNKNLSGLSDLVPIVTGFVAKNEEGQITTLGRGGSDYTAAIIGAAVKAEEIQIWTDVYGMMTANPKIVAEAKSILRISFNEAAELAFFGAKVLHPKTIIPAVKSNIPVTILNSFDPDHEGTTILAEVPVGDSVVRAISLRKDITLFKIKSSRMLLMHGFLAKLFEAFDKNQISVDMIATSEISVSMTFDNKNVDEKLEKIKQELAGIGEIYIEHGKAIISLVGIGLENDLEALNRISSTILNNGIQIHLISKGASEINIGFVIDDKDGEKAVKCLHKEFFE